MLIKLKSRRKMGRRIMSFILYSNQSIIYIQWNAWILSMEFSFDKCIYPCNSALSSYRGHPHPSTWYRKKSLWQKFSGFISNFWALNIKFLVMWYVLSIHRLFSPLIQGNYFMFYLGKLLFHLLGFSLQGHQSS